MSTHRVLVANNLPRVRLFAD